MSPMIPDCMGKLSCTKHEIGEVEWLDEPENDNEEPVRKQK